MSEQLSQVPESEKVPIDPEQQSSKRQTIEVRTRPTVETSRYQKQLEAKLGIKLDFIPLEPGTEAMDGTRIDTVKDAYGNPLRVRQIYSDKDNYPTLNVGMQTDFIGGQKFDLPPGKTMEEVMAQRDRDKKLANAQTAGTVYQGKNISLMHEGDMYLFSSFEDARQYNSVGQNTELEAEIIQKTHAEKLGHITFVYDRANYSLPALAYMERDGKVERMFRMKNGEKISTVKVLEKILLPYQRQLDDRRIEEARKFIESLPQEGAFEQLSGEAAAKANTGKATLWKKLFGK